MQSHVFISPRSHQFILQKGKEHCLKNRCGLYAAVMATEKENTKIAVAF